jgi:hypothetical protein
MPPRADILLTGLPRSGTTLACHLLNHLPDAVALFEPPSFFDVIRPTIAESLGKIAEVFEKQRTLIENTGTAESLSLNGKVPDNHLSYRASIENQRQNLLDGSSIRVDNLQPGTDYALIIKHPIIICSLLPEAAKEYPVFAIVRDPLSTHVSWCFTPFPVSQGRAGILERRHPELALHIAKQHDSFSRQAALLRWLFNAYSAALPRSHIIRYEEIIATGGGALAVIAPSAANLKHTLSSSSGVHRPSAAMLNSVAAHLWDAEEPWWQFYCRETARKSFEQMLSEASQTECTE